MTSQAFNLWADETMSDMFDTKVKHEVQVRQSKLKDVVTIDNTKIVGEEKTYDRMPRKHVVYRGPEHYNTPAQPPQSNLGMSIKVKMRRKRTDNRTAKDQESSISSDLMNVMVKRSADAIERSMDHTIYMALKECDGTQPYSTAGTLSSDLPYNQKVGKYITIGYNEAQSAIVPVGGSFMLNRMKVMQAVALLGANGAKQGTDEIVMIMSHNHWLQVQSDPLFEHRDIDGTATPGRGFDIKFPGVSKVFLIDNDSLFLTMDEFSTPKNPLIPDNGQLNPDYPAVPNQKNYFGEPIEGYKLNAAGTQLVDSDGDDITQGANRAFRAGKSLADAVPINRQVADVRDIAGAQEEIGTNFNDRLPKPGWPDAYPANWDTDPQVGKDYPVFLYVKDCVKHAKSDDLEVMTSFIHPYYCQSLTYKDSAQAIDLRGIVKIGCSLQFPTDVGLAKGDNPAVQAGGIVS